jgi:hypothetical protein
MADNQPKPRIIDSPEVREIYVNKTIGSSFDGATISLLLGCTRIVPDRLDLPPQQAQPPSVYVTGRIALSPAAAVELANALNGILATISKSPNIPVSAFPAVPPSKPN